MKHFKPIFFVLILISSPLFSQTYGELFSKTEADQLFGDVIEYVELEFNTVNNFVTLAEQNIMFKINNGQLIVLNENRNVIFPENSTMMISQNEVFKVYSVSLFKQLLSQSVSLTGNIKIRFERRSNVFSITYGDKTLERAMDCPPICD